MARNTKQRLADALKSLLAEKPLDRITVKEVSLACGLNRQTFYYNFADLYALLSWIFQEETSKLLSVTPGVSWEDSFGAAVQYLEKNRTVILNIYQSMSRGQLEAYLMGFLLPAMQTQIAAQSVGLNISQADLDFVAHLYVIGFLGITFSWLDGHMEECYRDYMNRFFCLVDGNLRGTLETLSTRVENDEA